MKHLTIAAVMAVLSAPAFAESHAMAPTGDAANGEAQFARQCVACHVVQNEAGDVLAGRNAQTGPNLYGIAGRQLGAIEDFRYSDAIIALGEEGVVYDEENFVGYVQDPTGWLREMTEDRRARGKMAYQVRSEDDARDLYAYIASLSAE